MLENELNALLKVYVDTGSTRTRSAMDANSEFSMDSEIGNYIASKVAMTPKSHAFEDNLYLIIDGEHLLFGSIREMECCSPMSVYSDNKCFSPVTRFNCLASIAIQLLNNEIENLKDVNLHVAFRPRDLTDPSNAISFTKNIQGSHIVEFPLLNKRVGFNVKGVVINKEPTADMIYFLSQARKAKVKIRKAILINGGGTSQDSIMFKDKSIIDSNSTNSPKGGEVLMQTYESQLAKSASVEELTHEQLLSASITGEFEKGSVVVKVPSFRTMMQTTIVADAKREIDKQLTRNREAITNIDALAFTGNLYAGDELEGSAIDLLRKEYGKYEGLTIFCDTNEFNIVRGLQLLDRS